MRTITRTAFAFAGAVALVGGASLSASAVDTPATVEVTAGALSISAPASVSLGDTAPGDTATGALATTTVSDLTADEIGWTATITVSDFTGADTGVVIPASGFEYTATDYVRTGTSAVTVLEDVDTLTADEVVGNNGLSWDADISLAIPADALADVYGGVITSSVS